MALPSRLRALWRNLVQRDRVERDLDDELRSTLDLLTDEETARGVPLAEARRRALVTLRIEPVKERVRDSRTGATMDSLLQDLGYAWRHIRRSPAFAAAAVLTLALGIGANTAMLSMLHALTDVPLAVGDPDTLVAIAPKTSRGIERSTPVDAIAHLRDGPLHPLCGYLGDVLLPVIANGAPVHALSTFLTADCLDVLQITPIIGRGFTADEAPLSARGARVALISHRLWTSVFGADPGVLGKTMFISSVEVEIIGVLPRGFVGMEVDIGVDIFTPFDTVLAAGPDRRQLATFLLGRLRQGVSREQAEAELKTRWPAVLDAVLPSTLPPSELANFRDSLVAIESMRTGESALRTRYVSPLRMANGLTVLLLVLACLNLGGLLLARVSARTPELAVRLALGGTRQRIVQQMLLESVILALAGAALAVPMAYAAIGALATRIPPVNLPYTIALTPDARILAATAAIGVGVGVLMSALPIWMALRRPATIQMASDRTIVTTTNRWGKGLLVSQVALSTVLLVAAALLVHSLYLLQHTSLGVRVGGIAVVRLMPLPAPGPKVDRAAYFRELVGKVEGLPSVRRVSFARGFPRPIGAGVPVALAGDEYDRRVTWSDYVSPGYFDLMGIPLVSGRLFTEADDRSKEPVVVVSESLAKSLTADGEIVGRRIRFGSIPADQNRLVIGVVRNATQGNPRAVDPPIIYRPLQLGPDSSLVGHMLIDAADMTAVSTGVREVLRVMGRDYAQEIARLSDVIARTPATERISATVALGVGALALVLALIGVHGVLAYAVARRQREIGLRVALGASPGSIGRGIVRDGLVVVALGLAIGMPAALAGARLLEHLLYEITVFDVRTYGGVAIFFLLLGAAAGAIPARRAATVDPLIALRTE